MTVLRMPIASRGAPDLAVAEQPTLARRLLRISDAAAEVGRYSPSTLNRLICQGDLPILILPSRVSGREPLRRIFRVPVAWLDHWIEMGDKNNPLFTSRADIGGRPGRQEPLYCSVGASASACDVSERLAQDLVRLGRWAPAMRLDRGVTIRVRSLDDWLFGLISAAERDWFEVERKEAVNA